MKFQANDYFVSRISYPILGKDWYTSKDFFGITPGKIIKNTDTVATCKKPGSCTH